METTEKTYKVLDHTEPLSNAEIRRLYDGYWVFIANAKLTETYGLIEGIPVVIGTVPFDGVDDGIYKKYRSEEYGTCCDMSLRHSRNFVSSLRVVGE